MRFAVLGSAGMFGSDMLDLLVTQGFAATGFPRKDLHFEYLESHSLAKTLEAFDVVINAVAFTDVEGAEDQEELANLINGTAPGQLAYACKSIGNRFLQISTDYVFDGRASSPYKIRSDVKPLNAYGRSKALGESLVSAAEADSAIIRTSWLYGAQGQCFPRAIAGRLLAGDSVKVVSDQLGQPTWTRDLAEQVLQYSTHNELPSLIHVSSAGKASWYDFACEIARTLDIDPTHRVFPIDSSELQTNVHRPSMSLLETSESFFDPIGHWKIRWGKAQNTVLGSLAK